MAKTVKLVTRAEYATTAKVVEWLRKIAAEIEDGKLPGARMGLLVLEAEQKDGVRYPIRTSGMTNAQAMWILENGKRVLMSEDC